MIKIISVNIARSEIRQIQGRTMATAIGKKPVSGPVAVRRLGLDGDEQADQTVHGGLSKAIYAYPLVHYAFWQMVRAQARVAGFDEALPHGSLGENLTLAGVDEYRSCGSAIACACRAANWRGELSRAGPVSSSTR